MQKDKSKCTPVPGPGLSGVTYEIIGLVHQSETKKRSKANL